MMTLILPIQYYKRSRSGVDLGGKPFYDYVAGKQYVDAILTLKSIPAISLEERKPTFGRWLSTNRFLGK